MATEWPRKPLSELCSFLNRGAPPAYVDKGGVRVLNQKCIRDRRVSFVEARRTDPSAKPVGRDRLLQPFDILVNSTGVGTLGRVAQVLTLPEPTTVDSHITIVRADSSKISPHFLGYALRELQPEIEMLAQGSTGQTELGRTQLGELRVATPPMAEQRAIAHILGTLDEKIEINRGTSKNLEIILARLFNSWFVSFDPVRVKLKGCNQPLPKEIADLFPDRFEDSELGAIPAGWAVTTLGEHIDVSKGISYKGAGLAETGVPLHNLNSVYEGGGYKYEGIKHYSGEFGPQHLVCPGDVMVANTEQGHERLLIGYAAIIPQIFGSTGIFSHHLYRARLKKTSHITPAFLTLMLNSQHMHEVVSRYANGTTVNMLPRDGLMLPRFALPPKRLVTIIDRLAVLVRDRNEVLVSENLVLRAILDQLSGKLVNGDFRLSCARDLMTSIAEAS